ncbi:hypothetical protein JCM19301_1980 [Jejuia pallidilutea]|uniref:Uncharacterized protein n=1 Tax=Jejuia pallidilutea TaxID=504487 RepID=A0A090VWM4_9FLAO|nr:hypothetical protein JCM19301_1980 [Jejuia pallidilutea]GAL72335.1 hypothetical protein JCM19302_3613 [Jejuia pallidilutea]GAL89509.1 hypothetical protein JCM19538_1746 [Jejuia pallidilutea]
MVLVLVILGLIFMHFVFKFVKTCALFLLLWHGAFKVYY